jgi:hypothetical protein
VELVTNCDQFSKAPVWNAGPGLDFLKSRLRKIDRVLAAHYGFTDEELDFIINYDIKYRMGRDAESDEG